jgi:hypothetical protein
MKNIILHLDAFNQSTAVDDSKTAAMQQLRERQQLEKSFASQLQISLKLLQGSQLQWRFKRKIFPFPEKSE